jgi:hypothetical protein
MFILIYCLGNSFRRQVAEMPVLRENLLAQTVLGAARADPHGREALQVRSMSKFIQATTTPDNSHGCSYW